MFNKKKKNYPCGSLFSKVQHYLNYQGLLSLCEWLQYIIYAYFVYVYVMLYADECVCIRCICTRVRVRVFLCKQVHLFCMNVCCMNVLYGCGYECYKMKNGHAFCTLRKLIERKRERERAKSRKERKRKKDEKVEEERGREKEKQSNRESEILGRSR